MVPARAESRPKATKEFDIHPAQGPAIIAHPATVICQNSILDAVLDQQPINPALAACPAPAAPKPSKPHIPAKKPLPLKKHSKPAPVPAPAPTNEPAAPPAPAIPKGYTRLTGKLEIRPNANYLKKGGHSGNRPWWISGKDAQGKEVNVTAAHIIFLAVPEMSAKSLPTPEKGCNAQMNLGSVHVKATDIAISRERK